jgi:hypothetical protein
MAYFSKEQKAAIAPKIKALLNEYGIKGSLAIENYSAVVLNIKSGPIDFGTTNTQVNTYHVDKFHTGKAREFLEKAVEILNTGNYDNSDIMTDYHDVGHYIRINIGRWDRDYELVSA